MIPRWLAPFLAYADTSTTTLRGMLSALAFLDVLPEQQAAIVQELRVRAWADAVEARLHWAIRWGRGGLS